MAPSTSSRPPSAGADPVAQLLQMLTDNWQSLAIGLAVLAALQLLLSRVLSGGRKGGKAWLDPETYKPLPLAQKVWLNHNTLQLRFDLPSATQRVGLPIGQHISFMAKVGIHACPCTAPMHAHAQRTCICPCAEPMHNAFGAACTLSCTACTIFMHRTPSPKRHPCVRHAAASARMRRPCMAAVATAWLHDRHATTASPTCHLLFPSCQSTVPHSNLLSLSAEGKFAYQSDTQTSCSNLHPSPASCLHRLCRTMKARTCTARTPPCQTMTSWEV